jgi:hypothetical protein
MAYTTINKGSSYFNTVLYTGDGTNSKAITGVGFQPDWLWIKIRSGSDQEHVLVDAVRGATKSLESDTTDVEETTSNTVASLNSDGFTLGTTPRNRVNQSGSTYVAWNWLANNTSGSSNTAGTITSTVAANTTAGFSIVGYTGNATAGATVGHGLGVVPKMIILKRRTGSAEDWYVYHGSLANTEVLRLNLANAKATRADFNNTTPTSTVFTINSTDNVNASGSPFIAYCFADVKGFSKFGSYTGNGSTDGTFIYTGFSPAFVMFKNTTTANRQWYMMDNKRNTFNVANIVLAANQADDESWWGTGNNIDFLSNGIKIRSDSDINNSGDNFIYMTFAQNPFVTSGGIPVTAR